MVRTLAAAALIGLAAVAAAPSSSDAGEIRRTEAVGPGAHRASPNYRRGPQVKGYVARRGGYSYSAGDVINTYGDSRSIYGGASVYRDRFLDRQTTAGPFDHGFFFDSGIGPRGGDSPYQN